MRLSNIVHWPIQWTGKHTTKHDDRTRICFCQNYKMQHKGLCRRPRNRYWDYRYAPNNWPKNRGSVQMSYKNHRSWSRTSAGSKRPGAEGKYGYSNQHITLRPRSIQSSRKCSFSRRSRGWWRVCGMDESSWYQGVLWPPASEAEGRTDSGFSPQEEKTGSFGQWVDTEGWIICVNWWPYARAQRESSTYIALKSSGTATFSVKVPVSWQADKLEMHVHINYLRDLW